MTRQTPLFLRTLAVLLSVAVVEDTAAGPARLQAIDIFDIEYASDPRISPDGAQVIYERRSNDIMTDSTRSNLWVVNSDGSEHRPLVSGVIKASSPRWSNQGDRIAYVVSDGDNSGIHVRWMDTGQTARVASLREAPDALSWSPDDRWLAFTMDVVAESEPLVTPPEKPENATWADPVEVIDTVLYRADGKGFLEPAFSHAFVVPSDGGTPRRITSGDFNFKGPISWAPDGSHVLLTTNQDDDWAFNLYESDIVAVSVVDGSLRIVTDTDGGESLPRYSPRGDRIAYVYNDSRRLAYRNKAIHIIDADGGARKVLTGDLDRSVIDVQWAADGRSLYFMYDDRAVRKVGQVDLSGQVGVRVAGISGTALGRPYMSGSFTVSRNGVLAYTRGSAQRPADVAVKTRRDERVLTRLNEDLLGNRELGEVHEIVYESSIDGEEIQGWYVTPPGFDASKKYPLILEVHGGPHSAYGAHFSAEVQRYAAEGYVVVYPNYRGSTSYGERFALLLQNKYSSKWDFADNMSAVDAVIDLGFIDTDNLFITGGSAGGASSAYAIGLTDRFRAAAVAKPVINWISKTLTADSYTRQITHQFPGMPWEEFEHYWQRSALSLVGNVVTPTLLITGEEDFRTPISETEQFYQALKLRQVDTVMIRVPGSAHGIAGRPSRMIAKIENILAWFERYRSTELSQATQHMRKGQTEDAIRLLQEATTSHPTSSALYAKLAYACRYAGLLSDSIDLYQQAKALDAGFDSILSAERQSAKAEIYLGKYDAALERYAAIRDLTAAHGDEPDEKMLFYEGLAHLYKGNEQRALQLFDESVRHEPDSLWSRFATGYKLAALGRHDELIEFAKRLTHDDVADGERRYRLVHFFALAGDSDQALRHLEAALAAGNFNYPYISSDPLLAKLRQSPAFAAVMGEMRRRYEDFAAGFTREAG